jgi:hypothetical protein
MVIIGIQRRIIFFVRGSSVVVKEDMTDTAAIANDTAVALVNGTIPDTAGPVPDAGDLNLLLDQIRPYFVGATAL